MKYLLSLLFFVSACSHSSKSPDEKPEIVTKEITYKADGKNMVGYLARPKSPRQNLPAVLVVHEWWGQTDYPRMRARMLAEEGYVAMAVDMYGDRKIADHPKDAGSFAKSVMSDAKTVRSRFTAALETLKKQDFVDEDEIAAIGYCFGGSVVLEMARQGVDLEAVVSLHGGLMTPSKAQKNEVKAAVLVLHGEADKMISNSDIQAFKNEMEKAEVDYQFISYPGALHAFTNPEANEKGEKFDLPLAYDEKADQKSWMAMNQFLDRELRD